MGEFDVSCCGFKAFRVGRKDVGELRRRIALGQPHSERDAAPPSLESGDEYAGRDVLACVARQDKI